MRGTALAAAALLVLPACGGGEEPEAPEPGPLKLVDLKSCQGDAREFLLVAAMAENTAEEPLTIDDVRVEGAANLEVAYATLEDEQTRAIDQTMPPAAHPDATQPLVLKVSIPDAQLPSTYDAIAVDYHNIDGHFTVVGEGADVRSECRG